MTVWGGVAKSLEFSSLLYAALAPNHPTPLGALSPLYPVPVFGTISLFLLHKMIIYFFGF